jgi:zinc protease
MRAVRWIASVVLFGCGASFPIAPDVAADRPHARASSASAVSFDEDAGPPAVVVAAATTPEIIDKQLKNGIRVLLLPRHDLPIVKVAIVIKRGAEDAPPGFAQLWITAATTATKDMSRADLNAWFRKRGAVATREAAYSHTTFDFKVVAPLLDETLDVATQVVLHGAINDDTVKRATSDHTNAVLSAQGAPGTIAYRTIMRALYPTGHPYGDTVVGEEIHPTVAELEAYRHDNVTAQSLAIVAAGDFEPDHVIARLESLFGTLSGTSPPPKTIDPVAPRARRGVMVARGRDQQVQIAIGFPGTNRADADHAALHVASIALRDATLHDLRLVEGATYTTSVFEAVRRGPAPIVLQTAVDPTRVSPALQDIWHAIDHLRAGLSEDETARFRDRALSLSPSRFDTLGSAVANLADIAALDLPATEFATELEALRHVTAADVKRVAEKYMSDQTLQVAIVGEPGAIKPAQDLLEYHPQ